LQDKDLAFAALEAQLARFMRDAKSQASEREARLRQVVQQKSSINDKLIGQLMTSWKQSQDFLQDLQDARQEVQDARQELQDARQELQDAVQELQDARQHTQDARQELQGARRALASASSPSKRQMSQDLDDAFPLTGFGSSSPPRKRRRVYEATSVAFSDVSASLPEMPSKQ
jgi:chromosome segregation ATPase